MKYIRWFSELSVADVPLVGGKNASLGEMYRELNSEGVLVPNGFAVTAAAYRYVLERAGAWPRLREALSGLNAPDECPQVAPRRRGRWRGHRRCRFLAGFRPHFP